MPAAKPPEFRRSAVELGRLREKPIAAIAKDLQISESCLRRWMDQADVDEGHKPGLSTDERRELVELRRKNGVLEIGYYGIIDIPILPLWRLLGHFRPERPLDGLAAANT